MTDRFQDLGMANLAFVEELYASFLDDPSSVPPEWRRHFRGIERDRWSPRSRGPAFGPWSIFDPRPDGSASPRAAASDDAVLQEKLDHLIRAYRFRGHMIADVDPLGRPREAPPELEFTFFGIAESDLERQVSPTTIPAAPSRTVGGVIEHLRHCYCETLGVEHMHISEIDRRRWLQARLEAFDRRVPLDRSLQLKILGRLTDAVTFEEIVQKKFVGAKSFSLEGAESLIPLLHLALEGAARQGVEEIVLGMAHRGRLNVLANIVDKDPREIFREFEDADPLVHLGGGDVKYHLGHSSDWTSSTGRKVHLSLCFNPSHLEYINPVALGRMRAKQDVHGDHDRSRGVVILMHGDASFAGEGVVQETLNLSELAGYSVGGTLHVIINNQIGFTTTPDEATSSVYHTGVAKMLSSPIFHVNGEDPEAVSRAIAIAMDYRAQFKTDVFVDMYCYRRRGHNEMDEPSFTQPLLYKAIKKRPPVRDAYLDRLLNLGGVSREEAESIARNSRDRLEKAYDSVKDRKVTAKETTPAGAWQGFYGGPVQRADEVETGVQTAQLKGLLDSLVQLPAAFHIHPKLKRLLKAQAEMSRGERPLDWGTAEALAFASLATEGHPVRLSGQDSGRGTFSQRHAILDDFENGDIHVPLQHLSADQARVDIHNSPLSESGVLGFEYGYSLDCPQALVMWEAQFGDFANVAQVITDQFIASAEDKWNRLSGIVLLLPHGFEGMGPEHSSAYIEKFLTLAAEDNLQIVQPSTPAQYFHVLRRQVLRRWRKPLIVFTPKSLLRHAESVSTLRDLSDGRFQRVLDDPVTATQKDRGRHKIERILLCAGKVYFELAKAREGRQRHDVAIIRLEELYPFPEKDVREALSPYRDGTPAIWVQEEPENMGAWRYLRARFLEQLVDRLPFSRVSRPESASPATGSRSSHGLEQEMLIAEAFGEDPQAIKAKVLEDTRSQGVAPPLSDAPPPGRN